EAMLGFHVDELVLEFANREMAEVEILAEIVAAGRDVAAGVIDVKNSYLESPDDVAERIDQVLSTGVPAERPGLVPDCGFSQTPRAAARAKLRSLVAGRDLVLGRVLAQRYPPIREETRQGRTPDHDARDGFDRRLLHGDPPRPPQ